MILPVPRQTSGGTLSAVDTVVKRRDHHNEKWRGNDGRYRSVWSLKNIIGEACRIRRMNEVQEVDKEEEDGRGVATQQSSVVASSVDRRMNDSLFELQAADRL